MENLSFLSADNAFRIRDQFTTPCYVYDEATLRANAAKVLAFPNAYGLSARYAMKACPNGNILRLFASLGLKIDASSGYEVERAIRMGVKPENISLSTQELPTNFKEYVEQGISVNICSLSQLERYGQEIPGGSVGLRFNPGLGSGGTQRTNVGGPASSFGIWHEHTDVAKELVAKYDLKVFRIHSHIGSGSDPEVWVRVIGLNFDILRQFPSVTTINLGGGYKVGRMPGEKTTDLQLIGTPMKKAFEDFAADTGRKIHLEVEPGTYLVANACILLSSVQDLTDTGESGYAFIKLDTGMTDNTRPSMYGAQHPMKIIPKDNEERPVKDYIVVGHCCESGDIFTPAPGDPEGLQPRTLVESKIGDLFVMGGAGAYCSSMASKNYNSFPESPEVMVRENGDLVLMRKKQTLDQILANETEIEL
ncbi:diaminopimelate decarboxylase [Puniceicoccaceae bacterium K14]|nr:diaminopimelate decarboxylase [Puniceicoccaceae bacterium K14]